MVEIIVVSQDEIPKHWDLVYPVYQEVFAGPPWDEAWKCVSCDAHVGSAEFPLSSTEVLCPQCTAPMVHYWGAKEKQEMLEALLARQASYLVYMRTDDSIVAFYWGFLSDVSTRISEMTHISQVDRGSIKMALAASGASGDSLIYYSHEAGVLPVHRGQRFSEQLFRMALKDITAQYDISGVMGRTSMESPMFRQRVDQGFKIAHQLSGTKIVYMFLDKTGIEKLLTS